MSPEGFKTYLGSVMQILATRLGHVRGAQPATPVSTVEHGFPVSSVEHESEILSDDGLNEQPQINYVSPVVNVLGRAPVIPYFAQGPQIVHYQWKFVSSLLKNSKNEEIVFPVNDDRDRRWARRLEWVIEEHLDRAKADMDQLQTDVEQLLRRSKEVHFRKYYERRVVELEEMLENAHRRLRGQRI